MSEGISHRFQPLCLLWCKAHFELILLRNTHTPPPTSPKLETLNLSTWLRQGADCRRVPGLTSPPSGHWTAVLLPSFCTLEEKKPTHFPHTLLQRYSWFLVRRWRWWVHLPLCNSVCILLLTAMDAAIPTKLCTLPLRWQNYSRWIKGKFSPVSWTFARCFVPALYPSPLTFWHVFHLPLLNKRDRLYWPVSERNKHPWHKTHRAEKPH